MKRAALIGGCVLAGFVGMFVFRVSEGLYADWVFLRVNRIAFEQQQAKRAASQPVVSPEVK